LGLVLVVLVGVNLYVFLWRDGTSIPAVKRASVESVAQPAPVVAPPAPVEPAAAQPVGRLVEGEVANRDSLGGILRREGLTPPEADALIRAIQPHLDLRQIRPGQSYRLRFDAAGALQLFEFQVSRTGAVRASRQPDGSLSAAADQAETELRIEEVSGSIESSLWQAMQRNGEDASLVSFFVDVFAYDINFFIDTHAGDTFKIVLEKEYLDGAFLRYRRVLAAEYSGNIGRYRAFWWQSPDDPEGRYYDDQGRRLEKTFLKSPLKFARVSSKFNPRRMHPVLHREKGHWGTDYAAPPGTPVWAAASGRIGYRGPRGGAGNCVILNHDNGLTTIYMHLSKFASGHRVGQRVKQKDVIGYVGSTGLATGPHLHFGVKRNGHYVDPQTIKMQRGPSVPKRLMERYRAETAEMVTRLDTIDRTLAAGGAREIAAPALPN
jgi:murein DD-endopeptidase MepM/ murein hydrolase activator NlpD